MVVTGSYVCVCKPGYTGTPGTPHIQANCYDVDECSDPSLNSCQGSQQLPGVSTETFGGNEIKWVPANSHLRDSSGDNTNTQTFLFDVASFTAVSFYLADKEHTSSYKFDIGNEILIYKCVGEMEKCEELLKEPLEESERLNEANYINYKVSLIYSTDLTIQVSCFNTIIASANDKESSKSFEVASFGFKSLVLNQSAFWRNVRKLGENLYCINTIGSYFCSPEDEENIAITYGGKSAASSSVYISEFSIHARDSSFCNSHHIPEISPGLIGPGMAVLNDYIFVCGGKTYSSSKPSSACYMLDLTSDEPSWNPAPSLPSKRVYHGFVTLKDSIFSIGGYVYRSSLSETLEFKFNQLNWVKKSNLPQSIYYGCYVSDEENNIIWQLGGQTYGKGTTNKVMNYNPEKNTWSEHSTLPVEFKDAACNIIKTSNDDKVLLLVVGGQSNSIYYYNFSTPGLIKNWINSGKLYNSYSQKAMRMFRFNMFSAVLMNGYSSRYSSSSQKFRNFFVYSQANSTFVYR